MGWTLYLSWWSQLLWVNLVTDGLPATALSFNPSVDEGQMLEPPRSRSTPVVGAGSLARYTAIGLYLALAATGTYALWWLLPSSDHAGWASPLVHLLGSDGHQSVSWDQLTHWGQCSVGGEASASAACKVLGKSGGHKPSTLALTVLVRRCPLLSTRMSASMYGSNLREGVFKCGHSCKSCLARQPGAIY